MKDSIIFLDIDGVLNSKPYCDRMTALYKNKEKPHPLTDQMDANIIRRIARLANESNSDIVLSSTWKCLWTDPEMIEHKKQMKSILEPNGIFIIDTTPDCIGGRTFEIRNWLDEHTNVKHFVSLDDDYPEAYYVKAGIPNHTIHTNFWCTTESEGGFQEYHFNKALEILKQDYQNPSSVLVDNTDIEDSNILLL